MLHLTMQLEYLLLLSLIVMTKTTMMMMMLVMMTLHDELCLNAVSSFKLKRTLIRFRQRSPDVEHNEAKQLFRC